MPIATRLTNAGTLLVNGSFDEPSFASGSISLNGAVSPGQYLSVPSSTIGLSGQSFTIEGWFYPTDYGKTGYSASGAAFIFSSASTSSSSGGNFGFQFFFNGVASTSLTGLGLYYNNGNLSTFSFAFQLNTWYHIALTKNVSTNTFTIFVNGNSIGSVVNSSTWTDNSPYTIGRSNQSGYERPFTGLINNFRIVRGTALYTTNFTPPTSILPAVTNTSLLLNVTNADDFIKDNGPNKFTVTNVGSATFNASNPYTTASTKFRTTSNTVFSNALDEVSLAAGSVSFNGTNQYLTVPNNNTLNMNTSDFTLEGWIYVTSIPSGSYYPDNVTPYEGAFILNKDGLNSVSWPQYSMFVDVNMKVCASFIAVPNALSGGPTALVRSSTTISLNTWYHVAFTRVGVNGTLWLNGVSNGTTSSIPSNLTNGARALYVAYEDRSPLFQTKNLFPGYISNLRIVKGTALYAANFTPLASILPAVANTSLLLNVTDSTNFIKDNGPNKFTVTNANTATFNANGPFNQGVTTVKQRQVTDGTLEVYSNFDEFTGAPIVDSSLQLWLDAGQTSSYPGTGTTWTDLSGNSRTGTLTDGPTFSTTNGGSIVFDGTNDFVLCSGSLTVTAATFVAWIRRSGTQNPYSGIIYFRELPGFAATNNVSGLAIGQTSNPTPNQIGYTWHGQSSTHTFNSNLTIPDLTWCMIAVSVTSTAATLYLCQTSGITTATNTTSHPSTLLTDIKIGVDDATSTTRFFKGDISSAQIYNKALTADEITTNFNALRNRYGI